LGPDPAIVESRGALAVDDATLIECARGGDQAAMTTLSRRYEATVRQRLYQRLPRQLRKRISVADVVQETLITAFERIQAGAWTYDGSFRAWLLRIADFKARQAARFHLRTAKRALGAELSQPDRPEMGDLAAAPHSPSTRAMAKESRQEIDAGLADLSPAYRQIIDLVHRHGCTMTEAGERMGRSADASRKLYARAIAALAKLLNPGEDDVDGPV
jgi:RNA polymerase sigma factor (sigma-70 family)